MTLWTGQKPKIVVAHGSFDIKSLIDAWDDPPECVQVRTKTDLLPLLPEADILVTVTLWENRYLDLAPRLKLLQSISSGVEQYDLAAFRAKRIHLCNGRGANAIAVAEHALALMLSLSRRLWEARDDQHEHFWRKQMADKTLRRRELAGSHAVIVGFGAIGSHMARLCLALGMRVTVVRHHVNQPLDIDAEVVSTAAFPQVAQTADHVILTCPATSETIGLVNAAVLSGMKRDATVINVARGTVIVEADLIEALKEGKIAGAGLDTFEHEPLSPDSPLWDMPNVVLTPHGAGDTTEYERRIAVLLQDNIKRLEQNETLINQIV